MWVMFLLVYMSFHCGEELKSEYAHTQSNKHLTGVG